MGQTLISEEEAKKTPVDGLFRLLSTNEKGLSDDEARHRLSEYGLNISSTTTRRTRRVYGIPPAALIGMAALLFILNAQWYAVIVSSTAFLIAVIVDRVNEGRMKVAGRAAQMRMLPQTLVRRSGKWVCLPSYALVPGDLIKLRRGDVIPADVKLTEGDLLSVDESVREGVRIIREKHHEDIGYAGSFVHDGEMEALVVATGDSTHTQQSVIPEKPVEQFEHQVKESSDMLLLAAAVGALAGLITALFRGTNGLPSISFYLVLVAWCLMPLLPAVLTRILLQARIALAAAAVNVRNEWGIEKLARMDTLCTVKTGVLTENDVNVVSVAPAAGFTENNVLLFATLCADENAGNGIDEALLRKSWEQRLLLENFSVVSLQPFDSARKRSEAVIENRYGRRYHVAKGNPEAILSLAVVRPSVIKEILDRVEAFAMKGCRTIGVARAIEGARWEFAGLVAFSDPVRSEIPESIERAEDMGIAVKVMTGDAGAVAGEVARRAGLGSDVAYAPSLLQKPEREAARIAEYVHGFGQTWPDQKYRIVELLQERERSVGCIGTDINDVPVMLRADVSMAVPGSKPAARAAADCSTEAQGLDSILDAVQTSRRAIGLMQGYLLYRTTETFRVLLTVTIAVLALGFVPLTSVMLLLLFILNDGTALWLSAGKGSPEMVSVECTDREKWIPVDLVIAGTVMLLGLIYAGNAVFGIVGAELQSFVFLGVVVSGQLLLPSVAVRKYFWKAMSEGRALLFVGASPVVATVLVTFGILMPAIQGNEILFVWGYSLGTALLMNVIKIQLQKWAALT